MSGFYDDFVEELAVWKKRYAGRPQRELLRLYFVALEREELVTVAYHDDLLSKRVGQLPLPDGAREILRQALVWTWRDEEMHAVYVRGLLLRHERAAVRWRAIYHNASGLMAGWATFVQQHVRWRDAPLSRTLATGLLWMGLLTGIAPKAVRRHLRFHSFREFCEFNIDAERTASHCWRRLIEVGAAVGLDASEINHFRRVEADEDHHRDLFQILARVLDDSGSLAGGVTEEDLVRDVRRLGERYLPRRFREELGARSSLGAGGKVVVGEATDRESAPSVLRSTLRNAGFDQILAARALDASKAVEDLHVVIKPSFMLGYHREDCSPITNPALLRDLVHALEERGIRSISVIEAPTLYDGFFSGRSVREVADYFGIGGDDFTILDASDDQVPLGSTHPTDPHAAKGDPNEASRSGHGQVSVSRAWRDADVRIVFGKMRSHPVEIAHLCLGTLEGLGERSDGFLFAERTANREVATVSLLDAHPPHFALLDAFDAVPDGLAGMMGCRHPKQPRRIYAGADVLAVDMVAARHMGMADPRRSKLIATACHWFGDPEKGIEVTGVDEPIRGWRAPYRGEWGALMSFFAYAVYVVASDRGALFLPSMDEAAFSPRHPVSLWVRFLRFAIRMALGLPRLGPSTAAELPAREGASS